jgi:hypothetical protein
MKFSGMFITNIKISLYGFDFDQLKKLDTMKIKILFFLMQLCLSYLTIAQNHGDIELPPDGDPNCAANLNAPLSSQDWFDCPTPGDIMHCQRFVEIGRNLFPTNKLEISHDDNDRRREGISINNTREDLVRTNEIYFRKKRR